MRRGFVRLRMGCRSADKHSSYNYTVASNRIPINETLQNSRPSSRCRGPSEWRSRSPEQPCRAPEPEHIGGSSEAL